jgi:hypothetical protein
MLSLCRATVCGLPHSIFRASQDKPKQVSLIGVCLRWSLVWDYPDVARNHSICGLSDRLLITGAVSTFAEKPEIEEEESSSAILMCVQTVDG